jgi:hypothetical protein
LPIVIRSLSSDWRQLPVAVTTSICGRTPAAYGSTDSPTNQEEFMFPRRTIRGALVCALLTCAVGVASAGAHPVAPQAKYYASYGATKQAQLDGAFVQNRDFASRGGAGIGPFSRPDIAAQARYYSSYGDPQPLTLARQPEPSDETPWLEIALIAAAALALAATGAAVAVRTRRRVARVAA